LGRSEWRSRNLHMACKTAAGLTEQADPDVTSCGSSLLGGPNGHPDEVAAALGMTRAAVYAWLAKYREGGLEALKGRPVPGRPPKLSGAQLARLYGLVVGNDPRQLRFAFALWTRAMVRELIRREFGVRLSEVSVGRLLRKLGLSPQPPLYRAYQQNPQAVARWKAEEYPAIREQAAQVGPPSTSPMRPECAPTTMRGPPGRRSAAPR
jgi:transposase